MFALVLVRLAVGCLLLWHAHELWLRGVGSWIVEDTAYRIAEAPHWYREFAHTIVLRWPTPFAWLTVGGAALAGCAYFVGAAVRPASVGIVLLMVNVVCAGPRTQIPCALLTAVCALACWVGDAGQRLGLDPWLPRVLSWSRGGSRPKSAKPSKSA